jgi:hypothetical protein
VTGRRRLAAGLVTWMALVSCAAAVGAQDTLARADSLPVPPLFATTEPLALTLTANLRRLRSDRAANAPWRAVTIAYRRGTTDIVLPARAKTRGIWRLKNCAFPPLRLSFKGKDTKGTLLRHLGKPKLVNYCRDTDAYEQYVLQEAQLYRIYQLLTPMSYRTRVVRITYVDSASHDVDATRYAIIVEDPDEMARRLGGSIMKEEGATAEDLESMPLAVAYLFQFMIGNLDFSFNRLHNTSLVATTDGRLLPVAYDFDYTGAVSPAYAGPDPRFAQTDVRDRRFRGYCALGPLYPEALTRFQEKKAAIYALYHDAIGQLMRPGVVRETLAYFDEFYDMIETPAIAERRFLRDCVGPP